MLDFCMPCPGRHGRLDKLLRTQNGLSALPTGECEHSVKAWEQIYRPAMRTHFAGNLEGRFPALSASAQHLRRERCGARYRIHCRQYQPDPRE